MKQSDESWIAGLSEEELGWFKQHQLSEEELEDTRIHCASCSVRLNYKEEGIARHPLLGVPVCENCKKSYLEETWNVDDEGYFELCRWCAKAGDILCCDLSYCKNSFCVKCLKRHLGQSAVLQIQESENWACLSCEPMQIKEQRSLFYSVFQYRQSVESEKAKNQIQQDEENCVSKTIARGYVLINSFKESLNSESYKCTKKKSCDAIQINDLEEAAEKLKVSLGTIRTQIEKLEDFLMVSLEEDLSRMKSSTSNGTNLPIGKTDDSLKIEEDLSEVWKSSTASSSEQERGKTQQSSLAEELLRSSDSEVEKKNGIVKSGVFNIESHSSGDSSSSEPEEKKKTGNSEERSSTETRRKFISEVDLESDAKLKAPKIEVILNSIDEKVQDDLKKYGEVYIKEHKGLLNMCAKSKRGEIDNLCNLGSLKSKKIPKEEVKPSKTIITKKNKSLTMGDISSDESEDEDTLESNDLSDSNKTTENNVAHSLKSSNEVTKIAVLATSSSSAAGDTSENENESEEIVSKKARKERDFSRKIEKSKPVDINKPGFMKVKLDETDSNESKEKASKRLKRHHDHHRKKRIIDSDSSDVEVYSNAEDSDSSDVEVHSNDEKNETEDSDSDFQMSLTKKRKKKIKFSDDSSSISLSDDEENGSKKRRKRIKKNKGDSSTSSIENEDDDESPKRRKNIHKILKTKKLSQTTKEATEIERERRKRIKEKEEQYNKEFKIIKEGEILKELILDFDPETKQPLVEVDKRLVKKLKPHQASGIKFMWDSVFESKRDIEKGKCPGGAILAHCMGLGKTLQTICLVHTVLRYFPKHITRVLVLAPVNTIKNWEDEFEKWCSGELELDVYEMCGEKDNCGRSDRLNYWFREGGVMIMGYDMFRNLTNEQNKKFKKKQKDAFFQSLINPGPDLVICDEGHILKNNKSALNGCMTKIKTLRRIILTGTPLQNNLSEYYAMVNFVKPSLLGTFTEFKNRFVNPIQNGQHSDSTDRDVRVMKKRSFILNDLLRGCLQRLDYNVLVPYLQKKHEYVLSVNLSPFQKKLYKYYLENFARAGQIGEDGKLEGGKKGGLFYDVQVLSRIWNHPYILVMAKEKSDLKKMIQEADGDLDNFIVDEEEEEAEENIDETEESSENTDTEILEHKKKNTRGNNVEELVKGLDQAKEEALYENRGWWNQFLKDDEDLENIELGSKMVILMDILKESEMLGDKVLVFSQSLLSLDVIETFLRKIQSVYDLPHLAEKDVNRPLASYLGSWTHGKDYFRMDGSTPPDVRKKWCSYFNKKTNHQMRLFLISTKAGGLGINLVAANRVIIFDASWNPAHDLQSIFRVYRFGQEKPVYIYRFLARGTMEEKIYDRQVTKQSLAARVVDEQQIERHFSMNELTELYEFKDEDESKRPIPKVPEDRLLTEIIKKHPDKIWKFHDHDSLLENKVDENLTEEERKAAWEEFENEKKGLNVDPSILNNPGAANTGVMALANINPQQIQEAYRRQNPHLSHEQIVHATRTYIMQIQTAFTRKPAYDNSYYKQEMARAKAQEKNLYPSMYRNPQDASLRGNSAQMINPATLQAFYQAQQRQQLVEHARLEMQKQYIQQQQQQQSALRPSTPEEIILDGEPEVKAYHSPVPVAGTSRQSSEASHHLEILRNRGILK